MRITQIERGTRKATDHVRTNTLDYLMPMDEAHRQYTLVATNLRRLMAAARISQSELAKRTGVNQPSIHRILSGKNPSPRQDTIQAIASYFEVSTDDFRYRDLSDQSLLPVNFRGIRIPLMKARDVGLAEVSGRKPPRSDGAESIVVYHEVSEDSVAFRVTDRAMEPRFNVDNMIVYDPQRKPEHGKFVAARVRGIEEAVIRQMICNEDGTSTLAALNDRQMYPDIAVTREGVNLLGRVVLRIEKVL